MRYILLSLMIGIFSFGLLPCTANGDQSQENRVVATVNGRPIYASEVEAEVAFQVYRLKGNLYFLLKRQAEEIIDQHLLAAEAAKRGITVEALLQQEVDEKVPPQDEKEVDAYLAEHPTEGGSDSGRRERIRTYLSRRAVSQRRQEFMESLRAEADIKLLIEPPPRPRTTVSIDGEPCTGAPDAPVTLIHFCDFTSKVSVLSVEKLRRIMMDFPDRIKWVHRNYFSQLDDRALAAAEMGELAFEQNKFWEYHDRIFALNGDVTIDKLHQIGEALGIKMDGREEESLLLKVREDLLAAGKAGVTAAPVVFVNGMYFSGTFSYDELKALVARELKP